MQGSGKFASTVNNMSQLARQMREARKDKKNKGTRLSTNREPRLGKASGGTVRLASGGPVVDSYDYD